MKKYIILLLLLSATINVFGQRGIRIGYIDMEYILEKVPNYTEAKNQLEFKAQKWKQEMEVKKTAISKFRESLISEKVLLTKELIEEREIEIKLLEEELAAFQEKKFGPLGELITQKTLLVQPIQDQVFNIVQDIAEAKNYDFIFDKSSDLTMLFTAKKYDISELVIRKINVAIKGEQRTKKQQKADDEKEKLLEQIEENPALAAREKALLATREARQKLIDDKKAALELRKKEAADRRQKLIDDKAAAKTGTVSVSDKPNEANNDKPTDKTADKPKETNTNKTPDPKAEQAKIDAAKIIEERKAAKAKDLEDRKKAIEEKRLKALADRETARLAKEAAKLNKP